MFSFFNMLKELDGPAVSALDVRSRKLSNVRKGQSSDGRPKFIISSSSVHVKLLVPAAFAVVSTHSSFRDG
jgi:hypothetical protein